jgi:hypothetical protein
MGSTTMWIILAVIALLALYFYNRSRPAARGTYNDPNFQSGGSIGGGPRATDDPNFQSSGSIGGGPSASAPSNQPERPRHDDENFKSGGSFGT